MIDHISVLATKGPLQHANLCLISFTRDGEKQRKIYDITMGERQYGGTHESHFCFTGDNREQKPRNKTIAAAEPTRGRLLEVVEFVS